MKKIVLFFLMMLPVAVSGQQKEKDIPEKSISGVLNQMKDMPHAFQMLVLKTITNIDFEKEELTYLLSSGEVITGNPNDDESITVFWQKIAEDNKVKEICNVPFGCTLLEAKNILCKKFGDPLYITDDIILYENKWYGGNLFDTLVFWFQSDGKRNYFNKAALCIYASDKEEAIGIKNRLHKRFSKRYSLMMGEDSDMSMGGLQPVPNSHLINEPTVGCTTSELGYGFDINIVEKDDYKHPYFVRILYGPYEFVNEEF